jgi:hypothetical protein
VFAANQPLQSNEADPLTYEARLPIHGTGTIAGFFCIKTAPCTLFFLVPSCGVFWCPENPQAGTRIRGGKKVTTTKFFPHLTLFSKAAGRSYRPPYVKWLCGLGRSV